MVLKFKAGFNGKVVNIQVTDTERHMRLAVKADLTWLFNRKPSNLSAMIPIQLREMLSAERRAALYDLTPPWREPGSKWHGIDVPSDILDIDATGTAGHKERGRYGNRNKVRTSQGPGQEGGPQPRARSRKVQEGGTG